jgi:hypothetical protein
MREDFRYFFKTSSWCSNIFFIDNKAVRYIGLITSQEPLGAIYLWDSEIILRTVNICLFRFNIFKAFKNGHICLDTTASR